jgi:hypothetical protein
VIAALGAVVAFTTLSSAATNDRRPAGSGAGKVVNGQVILTDTCVDSKLQAHDGFQKGDRCVSTEFGEVSRAANNPSLLITSAPRQVTVNTPFTLKVSTRNLIRDRFLAAGQGGYYVVSSVLKNGIERGHFHTACRMLESTRKAPAPDPVPAFFVATEDEKGGRTPDTVRIEVPGLPTAGIAQCASWAGDGSHRIPMAERANETPAFDVVRIIVRNGNGNGGNTGNGGNNGGTGNGGNGNGGNNGNTGGNTGGNGGNTGGNNGNNGNNGGNGGSTGNTGGGNGNGGNGNTGGDNGNNDGDGDNGGGYGDNGGSATTAPTKAPTKAPTTPPAQGGTAQGGTAGGPTTKDDFTPATRSPEPTKSTKPARVTTKKDVEPATESNDSDTTQSDQEETATPEPTESSEAPPAAQDYTYSSDDGVANSGEKPPTVDQVASKTTTSDQSGLLALTGGNSMILIGAAVVLMLVGMAVMALTRRQRPGSPWQ